MAEAHHKPDTHMPTTTRAYTVGYIRDSGTFEPAPAITLKGHWLAEVGFATGTPLEVRVLNGCPIVTAKEPQPEPDEPEIMQMLRRVCKLSARKQRQVTDLIEVISKSQRAGR